MSRSWKEGIEEPLDGLLAGEGSGSGPLTVWFPRPLASHSQQLLESLGVVVKIDPDAPVLSEIVASGRSGTTRREMSQELRERQRRAYYDRSDKKHLNGREKDA